VPPVNAAGAVEVGLSAWFLLHQRVAAGDWTCLVWRALSPDGTNTWTDPACTGAAGRAFYRLVVPAH
jgi:hypothetical protein